MTRCSSLAWKLHPTLAKEGPVKMIVKVTVLLMMTGLSAVASAHGRDGGGGIVFVCNEGTSTEKVYLADTYAIYSTINSSNGDSDVGVALESLARNLLGVGTPEAKEILQNVKDLTFRGGPAMKLLGDDDIPKSEIPVGCEKRQLAIQTLSSGVVDFDLRLFRALTSREQALFALHEGYVRKFRANVSEVRNRVGKEATLAFATKNKPMDELSVYCRASRNYARTFLRKVVPQSQWSSQAIMENACYSLIRATDLFMEIGFLDVAPRLVNSSAKRMSEKSLDLKVCLEEFEQEVKQKQNLFDDRARMSCRDLNVSKNKGWDRDMPFGFYEALPRPTIPYVPGPDESRRQKIPTDAELAAIRAQETAQMDKLGPPRDWPDASAPSVQRLPLGAILELTRDLDVDPRNGNAKTYIVEQHGLMTSGEFGALKLQYRFAFVEFFNANNGYVLPAHYPKGLRMAVTGVNVNTTIAGGHTYDITLKLVSVPAGYHAPIDPITRLRLEGRRSGAGEAKIPQLKDLLRPVMSLELP